jgi:hypothetical protein
MDGHRLRREVNVDLNMRGGVTRRHDQNRKRKKARE